ncbi:MAG: hypothetical protein HY263_02800 [Chloroflexi bacterium]|nr:hypothetical protein [Chloroflexota bacterium]
MSTTQLTVQDAPGFFPGSRVYRLACRHGVSSAALVPGRTPISDAMAVDLVLPGHHRRYGCACPAGVPVLGQVLSAVPTAAVSRSMR